MKKTISLLLCLMLYSGLEYSTLRETEPLTTADSSTPPRYKKRKIQRQNTPDKINQRNKGLLRQNGLAQTNYGYPNGWAWMLPNIDWKGGTRG